MRARPASRSNRANATPAAVRIATGTPPLRTEVLAATGAVGVKPAHPA